MTYSELLSAANSLSIDDRLRLVEAIWDGIAEDEPATMLTEAQKQELDRRLAELDAFPEIAISWETVKARAEARLRR